MIEKSNICGSGCAGLMLASFSVTAILITASFACGVLAQKKLTPRAIEPVRVSITALAGHDWDLRAELVRELQKFRDVAITKERADITIQLSAERFKGDCRGVVAAVLTTTRSGSDLQALAGSDWQEIARYLAGRIKQDIEAQR